MSRLIADDREGGKGIKPMRILGDGTVVSHATDCADSVDCDRSPIVVSERAREQRVNQDCRDDETVLNRDAHPDFLWARKPPRGSEGSNASEPRRTEQRWSMRGPRDTLLAAALYPKWRIGFVHQNVAWPIKNREDRRHALASQFAAVRRPGERPSGTLATSVLDTRSTLLTADLIAGRERPDSRHATHRTKSRLAHRVDAGAEAADVAACATMTRIGRGISTSRIRRRGDGVGARVHGGAVHRGVPRRGTAHAGHTLICRDGARRADVTHTSSHPDAAFVIVVSARGHEHHTDQNCGREKTTLNRDAHADFPSVRTLPRASERGNDAESRRRERNMTGGPSLATRIDWRFRGMWAEFQGRCRNSSALQQRRSMRGPRDTLLAAASNPKCGIGFVHLNVAGTVFDEDGRHALAGQFAAVRRPGERPTGTLTTSVFDTRSPLLTADEVARRRRAGSDHQTHGAQSRLAHRVDAVAEAADVAASATMIRIGRGISASRIRRRSDRVGACIHGGAVHRSVPRRGAAHAGHTLICLNGAGRADVTHTSSHPDAAFVIVVSTRGHEHHTDQNCGREKTTLNRDAHADFPSVRTLPRASERGNDAESRRRERDMTGWPIGDGVDRSVGERRSGCAGRRRTINALRRRQSMRKQRPLLAAASNPKRRVDRFVYSDVAWPINDPEDRRHAFASRLVAVRCPGERPSGALATSVLDTRSPLLAADQVTRRRRTGSDHQTHGAQSRLASRVDAGAEAANVAASATMIRVGSRVSASRVWRWGDGVGAGVHGRVEHRGVRRRGATGASDASIGRDRARRADVTRTSSRPDVTLGVVVSTRRHEHHTDQDCGREKTTLNRDEHADFPPVRTLPRAVECGNHAESRGGERNMTGEARSDWACRIDRTVGERWAGLDGRCRINARQKRRSMREPMAPLLAAALNPKRAVCLVHLNVARTVVDEDGRHALAVGVRTVNSKGEWVPGVCATFVLDACAPLFTTDVITGRCRVEADAKTLCTQARLTRRVDAVAEPAEVPAAAAVVGVRRGVSTSSVPCVTRVTIRAAIDHGVDGPVDTDGSTHSRDALVVGRGTGRSDAAKTARFADRALSVVVSACGHERHTNQDCGREKTTLNRDVHADFPSADTLPRASEHGNDTESQLRERNMTGDPNWGGAACIDRRLRGTWVESQGRRRIGSTLQQRRSMRGPRGTLLAAALNPECGIGFVHPNVAGTVFDEVGRHALAAQLAAVCGPGERPTGTLTTSILDTRSPLLAADEVARRRRTGSDHQTHGAQSRLASRVDAGAEAANVAASATMIRIGRGISASRIRRRGDRVGACIHGGTVHRGVRRRGAANAGHTLICRDGARRADVTHTSSRSDAAFVVVISTRGCHEETNREQEGREMRFDRKGHGEKPRRLNSHADRVTATASRVCVRSEA